MLKMVCRVLAGLGIVYSDSNSDLDENEEENLVFLGMTAMMDPPREESKAGRYSPVSKQVSVR